MISKQLLALVVLVIVSLPAMSSDDQSEGVNTDLHASTLPMISVLETASQQVERVRSELANTTARLASLETAIAKSADKADKVAGRASRYSLYTVLAAAVFSLLAQWMLIRHQRKISRADSESKVANSYVEWQLRQLSELYGPVRALLSQSNVLYRQMNKALVSSDERRFRLVPGNDFDNLEFQLKVGEDWVRFRTVKHIAEVYNKGYGIESYFDDVINVGGRLAQVIQEKAGFAREDDIELVHVMGEYLAHYQVVSRLLGRAKAGEEIHLNSADEQAVFPNQIQELVDNGFRLINKQVMDWRGLKTAGTNTGKRTKDVGVL